MNTTYRTSYRKKNNVSDYLANIHVCKALKGIDSAHKTNKAISDNRLKYSHRETLGKGDLDELGWPL